MHAFTLLELVLVVVIMATIAGIAVPRYAQASANYRLDAAVRRVTTDIGYAQHLARTTSAPQTVVFDDASETYQLPNAPSLDRSSDSYAVDLAGEPYRAAIIAVDFGGDGTLVFDGYGTPDTGGSVRLRVGGMYRTITFGSVTGKPSVSDVELVAGGADAPDPIKALPTALDF